MTSYESFRQKAADEQKSNRVSRRRQREPVDPGSDPYAIPLAELNVANPELFKNDAAFAYFKRLREEAPVHYCADDTGSAAGSQTITARCTQA